MHSRAPASPRPAGRQLPASGFEPLAWPPPTTHRMHSRAPASPHPPRPAGRQLQRVVLNHSRGPRRSRRIHPRTRRVRQDANYQRVVLNHSRGPRRSLIASILAPAASGRTPTTSEWFSTTRVALADHQSHAPASPRPAGRQLPASGFQPLAWAQPLTRFARMRRDFRLGATGVY